MSEETRVEIAGPHFEINETVEPTPDAAIKPAGRVGRVESRAWTEFRGQPGYWRYTIRWPGGGTSNESAKHLQVADRIACDLKVVVSGAPFKIETYTTQTVEEVVEVALAKAGIPHPDTPPNPTWQLRTEDGRELRHLVGDAELVDGETVLYLDPEVGGGGDQGGEVVESGYIYPGWQGTPPAEGTRRALIRDTIGETLEGAEIVVKPDDRPFEGDLPLALADRVEEALLRVVDQGATPESGSPASVAMDLLDQFEIPRTREGAILTIAQRVTALADELVETRRQADIRRASADGLAATVDAQQRAMDKIRAEGKVPAGTKELVIVLEDVSDPDGPPEYRFIELEDQDGRSVGSFPMRASSTPPLREIAIPYGRDDAWVSEVAYQAAGAGTRPLMEDHPDYVFPSERVADAVAELLSDFGIPRACRDCAEEELGHGAKEVDGRRDDTIKALTARCDSLLAQREASRASEDTYKAQRDSALHLLRWLIGDLIPADLIRFQAEQENS
jgi:hypothetical protein